MGPHTGEAGEHIVISRQFNLHLRVGSLCPLSEDFQNQAGPVDNSAFLNYLFDIALLHPGELVIKDYIVYFILFAVGCYLFQFSAADIGCVVRTVNPLHEFLVSHGSRCLCKELEFVQILINLPFVVFRSDNADKYGFFQSFFLHPIHIKAILADGLIQFFKLVSLPELENNREGVGNLYIAVSLLARSPLRRH